MNEQEIRNTAIIQEIENQRSLLGTRAVSLAVELAIMTVRVREFEQKELERNTKPD